MRKADGAPEEQKEEAKKMGDAFECTWVCVIVQVQPYCLPLCLSHCVLPFGLHSALCNWFPSPSPSSFFHTLAPWWW